MLQSARGVFGKPHLALGKSPWACGALFLTLVCATGGPVTAAHAQDAAIPAMAQGAPAPCPASPAPLSPKLASWPARAPLDAATDAAAPSALLRLGTAVNGRLQPTPQMRYALRPEKPGGSVSFGGLFAFKVEQPGTYRVALGTAAWIDVVKTLAQTPAAPATPAQAPAAEVSIAHGHGPACSGIRKMVDFALQPGTYLLQVSANAESILPLLVVRIG